MFIFFISSSQFIMILNQINDNLVAIDIEKMAEIVFIAKNIDYLAIRKKD